MSICYLSIIAKALNFAHSQADAQERNKEQKNANIVSSHRRLIVQQGICWKFLLC